MLIISYQNLCSAASKQSVTGVPISIEHLLDSVQTPHLTLTVSLALGRWQLTLLWLITPHMVALLLAFPMMAAFLVINTFVITDDVNSS